MHIPVAFGHSSLPRDGLYHNRKIGDRLLCNTTTAGSNIWFPISIPWRGAGTPCTEQTLKMIPKSTHCHQNVRGSKRRERKDQKRIDSPPSMPYKRATEF